MVVTAKPFATRDKVPCLLGERVPEPETSEDIDPSLEAVSRPRVQDQVQQGHVCSGSPLTRLEIFLRQQISEKFHEFSL
jgi:hypothetical protein